MDRPPSTKWVAQAAVNDQVLGKNQEWADPHALPQTNLNAVVNGGRWSCESPARRRVVRSRKPYRTLGGQGVAAAATDLPEWLEKADHHREPIARRNRVLTSQA